MQIFKNKSELYKTFFLLSKISTVGSAIFSFKFILDIFGGAFSEPSAIPYHSQILSAVIPMVVSAVVWLVVQFAMAVYAEKMIEDNNSMGMILGLSLAAFNTCSIFFPVGILGYYALLNKNFRDEKLLENRPLWLSGLYEHIEKWTGPKAA